MCRRPKFKTKSVEVICSFEPLKLAFPLFILDSFKLNLLKCFHCNKIIGGMEYAN